MSKSQAGWKLSVIIPSKSSTLICHKKSLIQNLNAEIEGDTAKYK